MKPLSVEMACLLGIQNEIQAVWPGLQTGETRLLNRYLDSKVLNRKDY